MLRDAEGDFRRELEAGKRRWQAEHAPRAVGEEHIRAVLSQWTGVPVSDPTERDRRALATLEETLHRELLGQDEAARTVARAVRRGRLGLKDPRRPVGCFLLLGPSGVGKTQLCRALASALFGSQEALLRFDMSEYMEGHSVSRLIGSPPGYVGHDEGGQLTERVRRNPWSVVLLDELEKAHRDVWSILLQVMEEGVLTDAQGRRTDFRNTVLVMTSNLGAQHFRAQGRLGFLPEEGADRAAVERAVLAVAGLDEPQEQNFVKKHTDQERERLVAEGLSENEALEQASLRVFGCPPGTYGAGVSKAIHSQNWESWRDLSQVYTLWSAHGYSSRFHGQAMPELFRSQLSSVGMTIKNESSVEIDMLDSDDFYSYHGGLIACVRDCSGQKPVSVAGLTADPARPETARVETELARVMRSRILNPKWLEGLKRHGYKGAQELSTTFDTFFGWDAAAEVASNWMYDAMARQFLLDEETRRWMEQVNDAAVLQMSERFLEAHQRGMWQAGEEELRAIRRIYMDMEGVMEDGFQ